MATTRLRDIFMFVTAFTLGHTVTLIFATFAGISANHYLIDAVIAVTVAYKGFENLDGFKRWFGFNAPNLLAMVFIFGLIHGSFPNPSRQHTMFDPTLMAVLESRTSIPSS